MRVVVELAIIVVGVLIALAVDQWASDRAARKTELDYLHALSADLRSDSSLFTDVLIPIMGRAREALDDIGPVVRGEVPFPVDTIAFLQQVVTSTGSFTQLGVRTTFEELLSTGSLRLIRSSTLRSSLASYYESKGLQENRSAMRASGYPDVVRTFLPGDAFGPERSALAVVPELEIRVFGLQRAVNGVRSEVFIGAMNRHVNYLSVLRPALDRVNAALQATLFELHAMIEVRD